METAHSTKQFIQFGASAFKQLGTPCSMYTFVSDHGIEMFAPARLPKSYRHLKGQLRMCFANAAKAAMDDPSLIYCEGYASSIIPVLHAWCLDPKGRVLELTWPKPGADYFGVPFQLGFVKRQLLLNGSFGLLDQMYNRFALVRGNYKKEEWYNDGALTRLSKKLKVNKNPRR